MYQADPTRYDHMLTRRCGRSGLILPRLSLGLWHNFGGIDRFEDIRSLLRRAFDAGIFHIDLANNYGPPPGSAEENFGRVLTTDFKPYRDELIISTKAGYRMWPGPFGEWGSRKYLLASLDQSLRRMVLDYVDIFYSHRYDPDTPLEETMSALAQAVQQGKALYVGISSYDPAQTRAAARILDEMGTPCVIHQPRYSMFDRSIEGGLLDALSECGMGSIVFSPLAQGLLTNKYLRGIPQQSRLSDSHGFLEESELTEARLSQLRQLDALAQQRGQSLAQMTLMWAGRHPQVTSVLVGVRTIEQLENNLAALNTPDFSPDELAEIDRILKE
jgi:L-glyceraldehyde 3-phosphate reductase